MHTVTIDFIAFSHEGKYFLSRSKSETVIWSTKTWEDLITINEAFGIVTSLNRLVYAIIQDGLYKKWNHSIMKEFSDDF